jgi:hypothetical protein
MSDKMKLIYIAAALSTPCKTERELNVQAARHAGFKVAKLGFYPVMPTVNTELNNGYGCTHNNNHGYPGCCYSFTCPIATTADLTSIKPRNNDLYEEYKNHFKDQLSNNANEDDLQPDHFGDTWMIKL